MLIPPLNDLAIIALGSNLGDSRRILLHAMDRLQELSDRPILKSSLWRTTPADCPPGSPYFVNAVAGFVAREGETPESLLAKLQGIESDFGRQPKKVPNEPRPGSARSDQIGVGTARHAAAGSKHPEDLKSYNGIGLAPVAKRPGAIYDLFMRLAYGAKLGVGQTPGSSWFRSAPWA